MTKGQLATEEMGVYTSKVVKKIRWVAEKNKANIPYTLKADGTYNNLDYQDVFNDEIGISWWTNGFFGGILWQLYHNTKNSMYAGYAREQEEKLDACFHIFNGIHHDVGFMWLLTAVADYKVTGNTVSRNRGLHAATILAGRYNIAGDFIRAWNNFDSSLCGWAIIDSLMNISLLHWASHETKDPRYKAMAINHADTLRQNFIKEDGSCYHIVEFDPDSGEFVKAHGGQGISTTSCWTRGQSWAVYGFTNSYMNTKEKRFLDAAKKVSDYFIDQYTKWGKVPVDFKQPKTELREDNSAACIAASGLIDLARALGEEDGHKYFNAAVEILKRVCEKRICLDKSVEATVLECAVDYHRDKVTKTLIYADYFLLESLLKLENKQLKIW